MYQVTDSTQAASRLAFGSQTAQFKELITFMAIVSIALWSLVVLTLFVKMWLCHVWYRYRYPRTNNDDFPL
jgi:hypothetical protein